MAVAIAPIAPVTNVGSAYGYSWKNLNFPKTEGYSVAGLANAPPRLMLVVIGMGKIARLTYEGSEENPQIACKGKEAECPCLRLWCAVLGDHGSDGTF